MKKGDYVQRTDGISIYYVTSSEDDYVYVVRCSTYSISSSIKKFKKTEMRELTQLTIVLTTRVKEVLKRTKAKDYPIYIQINRTIISERITTEKPDLLTFRTKEGEKLYYTFTYDLIGFTNKTIYLKLKEWINKTCGQKGI